MCGIVGCLALALEDSPDQSWVATATQRISHRGPDDEGFYADHDVALGYKRLAIIDLSHAGHQPMRSADGRYWMVFNGEIYNYIELGRELQEQGVVLRSSCDSEVLLETYARVGGHEPAREPDDWFTPGPRPRGPGRHAAGPDQDPGPTGRFPRSSPVAIPDLGAAPGRLGSPGGAGGDTGGPSGDTGATGGDSNRTGEDSNRTGEDSNRTGEDSNRAGDDRGGAGRGPPLPVASDGQA